MMDSNTWRILDILWRALPGMSDMKKMWLLGLVEGVAGEPGRVEREQSRPSAEG